MEKNLSNVLLLAVFIYYFFILIFLMFSDYSSSFLIQPHNLILKFLSYFGEPTVIVVYRFTLAILFLIPFIIFLVCFFFARSLILFPILLTSFLFYSLSKISRFNSTYKFNIYIVKIQRFYGDKSELQQYLDRSLELLPEFSATDNSYFFFLFIALLIIIILLFYLLKK